MILGCKVVVVMPAFNAAKTLQATWDGLDHEQIDEVILVDDASRDQTLHLAAKLGLSTHAHMENRGYGANQKTCYKLALAAGADVVVMVHPDYQYEPRLAAALATMVASGTYDCALGSRMLGKGALEGGMPRYKYVANRFLTTVQNWCLGQHLSEYHTGFRAYSRELLESIPFEHNANGFAFDNEILAQIFAMNYRIGEMSVPTRYAPESSSIGFMSAVRYGFDVLGVSARFLLWRLGLKQFLPPGSKSLSNR